jgi:hypothetical protein
MFQDRGTFLTLEIIEARKILLNTQINASYLEAAFQQP